MKRFASLLLAIALFSIGAAAQGRGNGNGHGHGNPHNDQDDSYSSGSYVFSRSDRDRITDCLTGSGGQGLPPGLAKRDRLPPGLQKQLQRNGHLPPGLEKKMQPLPRSCEVRLPRLPSEYTRVIVGNYVILRDIHDRILDLFEFNRR
jgi:hypothetical protein